MIDDTGPGPMAKLGNVGVTVGDFTWDLKVQEDQSCTVSATHKVTGEVAINVSIPDFALPQSVEEATQLNKLMINVWVQGFLRGKK